MKVFADFQVLVGYFKITNQTLHTLEKPRHFKTAIAAEQKVVLSFRKQIWNRYFKCNILFFKFFFSNDSKGTFGVECHRYLYTLSVRLSLFW